VRLLVLLMACLAAAPAMAKDITVTATPVPLNPDDPKQTAVGALDYVAGFALDSTAPEWGGYSGMLMASDGSSLLAVSDTGHWLKLALTHDADGKLTGVGAAQLEPLIDEAGQPVAGKEWSDAEEITALSNRISAPESERRFVVAFERHHRVWSYASLEGAPSGPAQPIAVPEAVASLPENSGLEAIKGSNNGMLSLIAEGDPDPQWGSRGWWFNNDKGWIAFTVERSEGFEPTGLAQSDAATLLLLERRYSEADGPAARISILAPTFTRPTRLAGYALAILRRPLSVDNFEAIATRYGKGALYVYLLSDDNQSDSQRTLLLQFRTDRLN
jgi:hypothetical protein